MPSDEWEPCAGANRTTLTRRSGDDLSMLARCLDAFPSPPSFSADVTDHILPYIDLTNDSVP